MLIDLCTLYYRIIWCTNFDLQIGTNVQETVWQYDDDYLVYEFRSSNSHEWTSNTMTVRRRLFGVRISMCTICWCTNFNLQRVLIWWVIDNRNWSKTRHRFDVASYWLRDLIKNSSCDWFGELISENDRKLVIELMWRVIDDVIWSKTRHVIDMVSFW
jgi:hypothetical protein